MENKIIPSHVAIIMDGNGRWAKKRTLPVKLGHKAGAETLRKIADASIELSIKTLTVFAFSTENWKRSKQEVDGLMDLMNNYLDKYTKEAEVKNTKVNIIGDTAPLSDTLKKKIKDVERVTNNKTGFCLNIAINYGGRDDILRAAKRLASMSKSGEINAETINENDFSALLDTGSISDPDLLIRTSGESRISNFLLWQCAYSELYFTEKLWPDFNKDDLIHAIEYYNSKNRTFGGR